MKIDNHLLMDFMLFGKEHREVHDWLDMIFETQPGYSHWLDRHHLEAIKKQYQEGSQEYLSAYMHILSDWISHFQMAFVPVDRKDLIEKLRYVGYYQEGDWVE